MASLILQVFILQLVLHLVNKIGASTINDFLWLLYNKFPTPNSKAATQQLRLRREIVRLKRELNAVSAQDDFAKWAKLRRQHDKAVADYDKLTNSLSSTRSFFDSRINLFRTVTLTGFRLWLQYWYMREALFWIPQGWLPGYVEWILSFPKAPRGSVSIQIWSLACSTVVAMIWEVLAASAVLAARDSRAGQGRAAMKAAEEKKPE